MGNEGSVSMREITADMLISEVLSVSPNAAAVFARHGLGCAGCVASSMESLAAVASVHDVSLDRLLEDLKADPMRDVACSEGA